VHRTLSATADFVLHANRYFHQLCVSQSCVNALQMPPYLLMPTTTTPTPEKGYNEEKEEERS
jgi:hypothetical protein